MTELIVWILLRFYCLGLLCRDVKFLLIRILDSKRHDSISKALKRSWLLSLMLLLDNNARVRMSELDLYWCLLVCWIIVQVIQKDSEHYVFYPLSMIGNEKKLTMPGLINKGSQNALPLSVCEITSCVRGYTLALTASMTYNNFEDNPIEGENLICYYKYKSYHEHSLGALYKCV